MPRASLGGPFEKSCDRKKHYKCDNFGETDDGEVPGGREATLYGICRLGKSISSNARKSDLVALPRKGEVKREIQHN